MTNSREELILGIDEAGRGCVIGPMVVAGVVIKVTEQQALRELGVKDSKQLSPARRQELVEAIHRIAERYQFVEIWPEEIDEAVKGHRLNVLEAQKMAFLINTLSPTVAYVDAPGKGVSGYTRLLRGLIPSSVRLVVENLADERYPVVSAASILAKCRRDELIAQLRATYGDFGSGYPSDEVTMAFVTRLITEGREIPPRLIRRSWQSVRRLSGPQQLPLDLGDG